MPNLMLYKPSPKSHMKCRAAIYDLSPYRSAWDVVIACGEETNEQGVVVPLNRFSSML